MEDLKRLYHEARYKGLSYASLALKSLSPTVSLEKEHQEHRDSLASLKTSDSALRRVKITGHELHHQVVVSCLEKQREWGKTLEKEHQSAERHLVDNYAFSPEEYWLSAQNTRLMGELLSLMKTTMLDNIQAVGYL